MSAAYNELLDATIQHLEDLKSRGVKHVAVVQTKKRSARSRSRRLRQNFCAILNFQSANSAELSLALHGEPKSQTTISKPAKTPAEKSAVFAVLRERALICVKCPHLAASRKNVVFGVGSIDAQLMFVGEAPGADEDEQGEPFVGAAGQLSAKIISATGLSRAEVYIANILKCRPDTPGQSYGGNRKPTPEEMKTCIPYLHEQIDLIQPKVIVALSATAAEGLLGKNFGHHKVARQLADVSRHAAHAYISSVVSAAQPGDEREAQSLGRHAEP